MNCARNRTYAFLGPNCTGRYAYLPVDQCTPSKNWYYKASLGPCETMMKMRRRQSCTVAFALVIDVGQNPQIQITQGQPIVTPESGVLFGRIYDYDPQVPIESGVVPFHWEGQDPIQLNNGEGVVLLAKSDCPYFDFHYAGTFNYQQ